MSIDEVRALVAERQRYDDWLAGLEARKAETPERVFARVHGDYTARRAVVLARLADHVADLEQLSRSLQERCTELSGQLEALEEQRVEAMIRNAVGEYDAERWEALRADVEGRIAEFTDDRMLVQRELDDIQALLAQARTARPAAPEPEPVAAAAPGEDDAAGAITDAPVPLADLDLVELSVETVEMAVFEPPASDGGEPAVESLPFLDLDDEPAMAAGQSVDAPTVDAPTVEAPAGQPPASVVPPVPAVGRELDDALAMFAETPMRPMPAIPAPERPMTAERDPQPPAVAAPAPAPGVPPIDPFDDLAFLHSVIAPSGSQPAVPAGDAAAVPATSPAIPVTPAGGQPAKTLRCTECGTLNMPAEWYCERCGGELAAF